MKEKKKEREWQDSAKPMPWPEAASLSCGLARKGGFSPSLNSNITSSTPFPHPLLSNSPAHRKHYHITTAERIIPDLMSLGVSGCVCLVFWIVTSLLCSERWCCIGMWHHIHFTFSNISLKTLWQASARTHKMDHYALQKEHCGDWEFALF